MSDTEKISHGSIPSEGSTPAWRPLTARQRRVLGTLMEKSKTTPDAYPMTYLGLTTGCNQKSNRSPVNNYSQEQIEESVDQLREMGAVAIVQGNGRVSKVRHYGYQWLGINKVEAAVMTELLLRGEQTVGELRTRASRMEPISDLQTLQQILQSLHSRRLVLFMSPAGRGQIVSHALYQDHELEQLKKSIGTDFSSTSESPIQEESLEHEIEKPIAKESRNFLTAPASIGTSSQLEEGKELETLKEIVSRLETRVRYLEEQLGVTPPS